MAEPILIADSLSKHYGSFQAVQELTLTIERGEIFGLLGPNGAGKTTSILMFLGLTEPTSGRVTVVGYDPVRFPLDVKRRVGYLPDNVGFYEEMSGWDNLLYTAALNAIPRDEAEQRASQLLERMGLTVSARKKVGAYSRGMKQRLGLADILMKEPDLVILDEPTLGIDPEGVRELLQMIRSLSREQGMTVLLSSHHLHQVQEVCDRVGIFFQGRLVAQGPISHLSAQIMEVEDQQLELAAVPFSEELRSALEELPGVVSLEREGQVWLLRAKGDVCQEAARLLNAHQALVTHFYLREYGLDEIYRRYFEGGEPIDVAR